MSHSLYSPPQSQAAAPSPSRNYPIFYQKIGKKGLLPHTQTKKFRLPRFSTANKSLIHSFTQQFHRNSGKSKAKIFLLTKNLVGPERVSPIAPTCTEFSTLPVSLSASPSATAWAE